MDSVVSNSFILFCAFFHSARAWISCRINHTNPICGDRRNRRCVGQLGAVAPRQARENLSGLALGPSSDPWSRVGVHVRYNRAAVQIAVCSIQEEVSVPTRSSDGRMNLT